MHNGSKQWLNSQNKFNDGKKQYSGEEEEAQGGSSSTGKAYIMSLSPVDH